jgi:hypothetical protein
MYRLELQVARPLSLAVHQNDDAWHWHKQLATSTSDPWRRWVGCRWCAGYRRSTTPNSSTTHASSPIIVEVCSRSRVKYYADKPLELVHDDLYEPVMPATTGGRRYFLLLVNDTTHYMWVVLLAAKSDAASANKRIQAAAKNECSRKLQVLRTDNGGEFMAPVSRLLRRREGRSTLLHDLHPTETRWSGRIKQWWRWRGRSSSRGMPAEF